MYKQTYNKKKGFFNAKLIKITLIFRNLKTFRAVFNLKNVKQRREGISVC